MASSSRSEATAKKLAVAMRTHRQGNQNPKNGNPCYRLTVVIAPAGGGITPPWVRGTEVRKYTIAPIFGAAVQFFTVPGLADTHSAGAPKTIASSADGTKLAAAVNGG